MNWWLWWWEQRCWCLRAMRSKRHGGGDTVWWFDGGEEILWWLDRVVCGRRETWLRWDAGHWTTSGMSLAGELGCERSQVRKICRGGRVSQRCERTYSCREGEELFFLLLVFLNSVVRGVCIVSLFLCPVITTLVVR